MGGKCTHTFFTRENEGVGWGISDLTSIINQSGAESSVRGAPLLVLGDVVLKLGDYFLGAIYIRNKYSNTLRRLQIIIKRHRRNHSQTRKIMIKTNQTLILKGLAKYLQT